MREQDINGQNRLKMESELIQKTLEGDNEAFAELIKGYYQMFYSIAYGYLRNHAEAEDVVQDGVIRIHEGLGALQDPDKFRAWAYTIIRRRSIRALRDKREETRAMSEYGEQMSQEKQFLNPQELDSPVHDVILDCMLRLPAKIQKVAMLYYVEKKDFQEISEVLNISVRAIEMRLHRARKLLRDKVRRHWL